MLRVSPEESILLERMSSSLPPSQRVVVTGLGSIASIGHDVDTFWKNLLAGQCGIDRVSHFDPKDMTCQIGAEVRDWQPEKFMDPKEARRNDRYTQFGIIAAKQAGAPISDPEIVERLGVDPDTQLTRQLDWDKKKLRASQGNQPLAQAANTAVGGPSSGGAAAQATSAQQLTTTTPSQ